MPNKDSGFEDEAENNDDQDPESLEPMSEGDVTENLSKELIAERHRFLEWVFYNEELQKHLKSHVFKMRIPVDKDELIEEVRSRVYEYCTSGYGKDNKFQTLWRAFENQHNSGRRDPAKDLLVCLKNTFNSKCIDAIKPYTKPNPNLTEVQKGGPKFVIRVELEGDHAKLEQAVDIEPEFFNSDSGMGNRIRECLRKDCRSKHLSTFIAIINLWEEGVDKPVDICLKIPGLSPKTYNDLQGSLRKFLKKNVKFWLNDEEDPS
jgi:hypothetical protein